MEFVATKMYLNLPVKNGAPLSRLTLSAGGRIIREFDLELTPDNPDFWVFLDLSPFQGETLVLQAASSPDEPSAWDLIHQDDRIEGAESLYQEKYRPQFHFSPRRGWNNDPNGLVYYQGEYHLFFQHNPYGWKWGNMHWGHAVSEDLVHWRELPVALYPHQYGDWVYSGSAVIDWKNTGGFQTGPEPAMVAAYTSTGRGECIAHSNDRGRTFTDYSGDPVVVHQGRDPKIIWYAPGAHWVMAVYDERGESRGISFYASANLRDWEFKSRLEGYYECPELFELPVAGEGNTRRWVVYSADGAYAIGDFDGHAFTTESGKHPYNYGNCFYASQTFNDVPAEHGRRIQMAWGRIGHPEMPFNQMMNLPVELTLRRTEEGLRLFAQPVREIELLHRASHDFSGQALGEGATVLEGLSGDLFHIRAELGPDKARRLGFTIRGLAVTCDVLRGELQCLGQHAPLHLADGKVVLEILVDRLSVEVFADQGRIYMPMGYIPPDEDHDLALFAEGGPATAERLESHELNSAWADEGV